MQELVYVQNHERDGFKPSKSVSYYKCNAYIGYWKFEKQRKEDLAVNSPSRDDC